MWGYAVPTQVSSFLSASVSANASDSGLSSGVKMAGSGLHRPQDVNYEQKEIEEKKSNNSLNRKATTFWKVGRAEK